jgi:hypothetical protein
MIERGTGFIGGEQAGRPSNYWIFAVAFGKRMRAWLRLPSGLRRRNLPGPWKQSSSMHMNGPLGSEGVSMPMSTHVVQGFLRLSLNEEESRVMLKRAKSLGRYLTPLEVSSILKKEIKKTIADHEMTAMEMTWIEFCRENDLDQGTTMTNTGTLEMWCNYVAKNFHQPLPEASPWDR